MRTVKIKSYTELVELLKKPEITDSQALEIACKGLKVICVFPQSKAETIASVEHIIKTWIVEKKYDSMPIFLNQRTDEFKVSDAGYANLKPMEWTK